MVNEQITPVVTPVAPVQSPVVETPVVVPIVTSTEVVQPAPVTETVVAPPAEAPAQEAPKTVLGEALDQNKPQVEPVKAPEEQKTDQEVKSEEPAPTPPVYDAFTLPEGVSLEEEGMKGFTGILSELELKTKADHTAMQEFGQKAVDLYVTEVKKAAENLTKLYQTTWERQKTEWKDTFLKDPEIGGNRFQTTVDSALNFIRTHGGTSEQQVEFRNLMETSGLGNHPAMIRLLAKAGTAMSEGRPLATVRPVTATKSKTATLYGASN